MPASSRPTQSRKDRLLKRTKSGFEVASAPGKRAVATQFPLLSVAVVCEDEIGRRRIAAILERVGLHVTLRVPSLEDLGAKSEISDAVVIALGGAGPARAASLAA